MEENLFKKTIVETPRNSEQRCLCVLCLDVSGSIKGAPGTQRRDKRLYRSSKKRQKFTFWAVGSENYNHRVLSTLCHPSMPPKTLDGLKCNEFFQWLTATTMTIVSKSSKVEDFQPPPTVSWEVAPSLPSLTQRLIDG